MPTAWPSRPRRPRRWTCLIQFPSRNSTAGTAARAILRNESTRLDERRGFFPDAVFWSHRYVSAGANAPHQIAHRPERPGSGGCFLAVLAGVLWVAKLAGGNVLAHSDYDSYTPRPRLARRQPAPLAELPVARARRLQGRVLGELPAGAGIPMFFLSFVFGEQTPSAAMVLLYFLAGLGAIYALFRRYQPRARRRSGWCSWPSAARSSRSSPAVVPPAGCGSRRRSSRSASRPSRSCSSTHAPAGLGTRVRLPALAVDAGPSNIVYFPVLMWVLLGHLEGDRRENLRTVARLLAPARRSVPCSGSTTRPGSAARSSSATSTCPSSSRRARGCFLPYKIPEHFKQVLQLPTIQDGKLTFPPAGGWAFYLTNEPDDRRRARRDPAARDPTACRSPGSPALRDDHPARRDAALAPRQPRLGVRHALLSSTCLPALCFATVRGGGLTIRNPGAMLMGGADRVQPVRDGRLPVALTRVVAGRITGKRVRRSSRSARTVG